jgi:hypothetical protein
MNLRKSLAIIAVFLAAGALIASWFFGRPPSIIDDVPFTLLAEESLKVKQEQSRSAFQLTLVLLGGVWATLLAKKDEKTFTFSDTPETIMFCCSNLLLLCSIYFHLRYLDAVSNQLWLSGKHRLDSIPDFYNSFLNNPYASQFITLAVGLICTAIHLTVIHKYK